MRQLDTQRLTVYQHEQKVHATNSTFILHLLIRYDYDIIFIFLRHIFQFFFDDYFYSLIHLFVFQLTLCILNGIDSIRIRSRSSDSNGPLVFTKWPPVKHSKHPNSLRQHLMYHLQANSRLPPKYMMNRLPLPSSHKHVMRPAQSTHRYAVKKYPHQLRVGPFMRPTLSSPQKIHFNSSPPGPNTGEYIYENPFIVANGRPIANKMKVSITGDNRYSPIHTIPAPNLAIHTGYDQFLQPLDNNQLNERDYEPPQFNRNLHQYQVTEAAVETEQAIVKQRPYEAPETDLFANLRPNDAFGQSSNTKTIPLPVDVSFITTHSQMQAAPAVSQLVQMSEAIPQQQLPDTYALPISNQPQLQQHLLQQQAMVEGVPMAVYNPSYLVQQSNNLLEQHREHLFKPAPAFLGSINQQNVDNSQAVAQPLTGVESVASHGQLLSSIQNQKKNRPQTNEFTVSNAMSPNSYQSFHQIIQKPISDVIVGQNNGQTQVPQPILSESELASLLNLGSSHIQTTEQGFIASSYYQTVPDSQPEIEDVYRQHENAITINNANAEAKKKLTKNTRGSTSTYRTRGKPSTTTTTTTTTTPAPTPDFDSATAYEVHKKNLADTFNGRTKLMIVVPDEKVK